MRYVLGSSFFEGGKGGATARQLFSYLWFRNNLLASPQPRRTIVVCEGGSRLGFSDPSVDVISLAGDLGYCGQLMSGEKKSEFSSWSISMLACALLAYDDESDFIYKENDCLAFGPWVEKMYSDLGDGDIVYGFRHTSPPWQVCSQSLFLVRNRWIPTFVREYLSLGTDADRGSLGELKFEKMEAKYPRSVRKLSFGVDRERPIPYGSPVWYAQQITPDEIEEMRRRELI